MDEVIKLIIYMLVFPEVGQALLQKHELDQKKMENFQSALEHQVYFKHYE